MQPARRAYLVAAVGALALQTAGLYSPGSPSTMGFPGLDKAVHVVLFALPVWLFLRAGLNRLVVLTGAVAQAVISEIAQAHWIPHRGGDVFDALADLCGVGLGFWLAARAGRVGPTGRVRGQRSFSPSP